MSSITTTAAAGDGQNESENPRPVLVTRAAEVKEGGGGETTGLIRQAAIVNLSPSLCGILARAGPSTASAVHHHGPQDTIVYAVSGHGSLVSSSSPAPEHRGDTKVTLQPGDWALIPAYREHQEVNHGDDELVWVIVRAPGGAPETVNLSGWNGDVVQ